MLTALISAGFGALNALLPDVMGYFKRKQEMAERAAERQHEKEMLVETTNSQLALASKRLEEVRIGGEMVALQEEIKGGFAQMQAIYEAQKPIGNTFADVWNAILRPLAVTLILVTYVIGMGIYEVSVICMWWEGTIQPADIMEVMFKGLVGESVQAVLGYLFGYRGTNSARAYVQQRT